MLLIVSWLLTESPPKSSSLFFCVSCVFFFRYTEHFLFIFLFPLFRGDMSIRAFSHLLIPFGILRVSWSVV